MSGHFNIVLSRLKNLLKGIAVKDPDFDNLCTEHAALTAQIRKPETTVSSDRWA